MMIDPMKYMWDSWQVFKKQTVLEADMIDQVGELDHLIREVRAYRNALLSETPEAAKGNRYRAVESRSAKRTFNTQSLLARVVDRLDTDPAGAIHYLMEHDAVRLTWRWTELKATAHLLGFALTTAPREVEDGDPEADIGETWSTSTRVLGVQE